MGQQPKNNTDVEDLKVHWLNKNVTSDFKIVPEVLFTKNINNLCAEKLFEVFVIITNTDDKDLNVHWLNKNMISNFKIVPEV
jgi:hypothetical protein